MSLIPNHKADWSTAIPNSNLNQNSKWYSSSISVLRTRTLNLHPPQEAGRISTRGNRNYSCHTTILCSNSISA